MNTSARNYSVYLYYKRPWLRDELFAAILTVIAFYLVVALSIFEVRSRRKVDQGKKKGFGQKLLDFSSKGSLCLVAVIFAFIRCLCEQIELRLGRKSDLACLIYLHQLVEVFHLALTSLYLILWTRQLKMYRHRALRHLGSPFLRAISVLVLFGILGTSIASAASYLSTFTMISSPVGCVYDLSYPNGVPSSLPGYLLFAISFIFQSCLLALLVYPLAKHYHLQICCCRVEMPPKQEKIKKTIIRLCVCTLVCVLSDLVSSALLIFLHDGISPIFFWANIYTTNLLINIVAVVISFADWKRRLFPCFSIEYDGVTATGSGPTSSSAV
ncbi:uncharacterized protein LOC143469304 [Clavelina lepadiformis]|uniref:uncharacterized protein LOC143469304 n=1 Tax=Clavelina lepadiformis TaxID=159417 RepID=UPI0040433A80